MNLALASSIRSARAVAIEDDLLTLRSYAFESLSANATVLDGRGEIVDTNEAWRLFARLNDGSPSATGRGVSYLTVCDRAAASGDRVAAEVATGLRQILAGDRERYTLDYPCPSPTEDRWFRLEASSAPVVGGGGAVIFHVEVTADKLREGHLVAAAERDPLTGLPNRRGAVRAIEEHLGRARQGDPICVAFLDLDAFKAVNDRYGHQVGDQLLVKVGVRARGAVRHDDVVCRIGGDEFVLVCPSVRPGEVASILARLRWSLSQPFQVGSIELDMGVSIGHVLSDADATVERLLDGSDAVMYRDKERRRMVAREGRDDPGPAVAAAQRSSDLRPGRWNGIERRMRRRRMNQAPTPQPPTIEVEPPCPARSGAENRLRTAARMLDCIGEALVAWDSGGTITFINAAAEDLWQVTSDEAIGSSIGEVTRPILSPEQMAEAREAIAGLQRWEGEIEVLRRNGDRTPIWFANSPMVEDGEQVGYLAISMDISERRATEARLLHQMRHDTLTGLPTRLAFCGLVDDRLVQDRRPMTSRPTVMLIDIGRSTP